MSTSVKNAERLVAIAQVARPHGVLGELRLKVYNPETDLLGRGRAVTLKPVEGPVRAARVARVRETEGALLVMIDGVSDRNAADALRGAEIFIKRAEFPELADGEFYACDVEGARVELSDGTVVGVVKRLASYPTCDVLVISKLDGQEVELPLVDGVVDEVDSERGVVRISSLDTL